MLQTKTRTTDSLCWAGDPDDFESLLTVIDQQMAPLREADVEARTSRERKWVTESELRLADPSFRGEREWATQELDRDKARLESAESAVRDGQKLAVSVVEKNNVLRTLAGSPSEIAQRVDPRMTISLSVSTNVSKPNWAGIDIQMRPTLGVMLQVTSESDSWVDSAHVRISEELRKSRAWWHRLRGNTPVLAVVVTFAMGFLTWALLERLLSSSETMATPAKFALLGISSVSYGLLAGWGVNKLLPAFVLHRRGDRPLAVKVLATVGGLLLAVTGSIAATILWRT